MGKNLFLILGALAIGIFLFFGFFNQDEPGLASDEWTSELPADVSKAIESKYTNLEQKNAAYQFAKALWLDIGPDADPIESTRQIFRAMDCLRFRNIGEDRLELRSLVLSTKARIKSYLENDKAVSGNTFQSGDPNTSCDQ